MRTPPTRRLAPLAIALLLAALPAALHAQRTGGSDAASPGWPAGFAGIRVGYDSNSNGTLTGAQLRLPVLPSGHLELVPNAEVTFLTGLREYQGGVDAVLVSGGRQGGFYAGGGIAWRNTVYSGTGRETRTAATVVAGLRSGVLRGAPFATQLELRWTFVDAPFKPRGLTIGVNFPLWGAPRR